MQNLLFRKKIYNFCTKISLFNLCLSIMILETIFYCFSKTFVLNLPHIRFVGFVIWIKSPWFGPLQFDYGVLRGAIKELRRKRRQPQTHRHGKKSWSRCRHQERPSNWTVLLNLPWYFLVFFFFFKGLISFIRFDAWT